MKTRKTLFALVSVLLLVAIVVTALPAQQTQAQGSEFPISLDHPFAPFLESRAYAQSVGATAEWRKMEGVRVDPNTMTLYLAMSEISSGMSDGEGDIQLEENPCGIVYAGDLDENYTLLNLRPLIVGGPYDEAADPNNACSVDAIANPDGLAIDGRGRIWVAEDTGDHYNNMLWVYDPADGSLQRFATVPVGAEITGAYVAADGTLFFNVQHPDPTALYPFNRGVFGVVEGYNANTDDFEPVGVPEGDATLDVVVPEGLTYRVLGRVGDPIPNEPFGYRYGEQVRVDGTTMGFCNDPDGNMWLPVTPDEGYLYTNFECRPGVVAKSYIRRDETGHWSVLEGELVDFSAVNGTWNNCNASVTPWGTALTSEEYPSESAADWDNSSASGAMADYLAGATPNPYDYGYIVELIPSEGVGTNVFKHYAMGRFSMEQATVMPDQRTVYYGDDGTNRVLFRFVAAEPGDLSYGTLYAARATQQEDGSFDLEWIELGVGDDLEIWEAIRELDAMFAGM